MNSYDKGIGYQADSSDRDVKGFLSPPFIPKPSAFIPLRIPSIPDNLLCFISRLSCDLYSTDSL